MAYIVAVVEGNRKALSNERTWIESGDFMIFENRISARRFITDNFVSFLSSGAVTGITVKESA